MKARMVLASMGVALVLAVGGLNAHENESAAKKFKATCPVSGRPAIESSVVELPKGEGKVYFCCTNCPKAFQKEPAKYENQVRRQLAETGQIVQVACPISGHPFKKEVTAEFGATNVGFCCKNCLAKFNAENDEGKLKVAFADLEKGFTRQTKCPLSGKPISAEFSVEHEGKKVYFCCAHCPAAFEKDPKKYTAKLPQFARAAGETTTN